jgi:hypothetical protein
MQRPCHYFFSPQGCNRGAACSFDHSRSQDLAPNSRGPHSPSPARPPRQHTPPPPHSGHRTPPPAPPGSLDRAGAARLLGVVEARNLEVFHTTDFLSGHAMQGYALHAQGGPGDGAMVVTHVEDASAPADRPPSVLPGMC